MGNPSRREVQSSQAESRVGCLARDPNHRRHFQNGLGASDGKDRRTLVLPDSRHDSFNYFQLFSRIRDFGAELVCANRCHPDKILLFDVDVALKVGSDRFSSCALPRQSSHSTCHSSNDLSNFSARDGGCLATPKLSAKHSAGFYITELDRGALKVTIIRRPRDGFCWCA